MDTPCSNKSIASLINIQNLLRIHNGICISLHLAQTVLLLLRTRIVLNGLWNMWVQLLSFPGNHIKKCISQTM